MIEVLQFTAPWCSPCRPVERALRELAARFPTVRFAEIDLDREPAVGARYGVLALPTVVVLRDGEVVRTIDGPRGQAVYERALAEVVPAAELAGELDA